MASLPSTRSVGRPVVLIASAWYLATVSALWISPLTRTLHAESGAAVACVAFLVTGLLCIGRAGRVDGEFPNPAPLVGATLLPYGLLAASTIASPGCWSVAGSVLFAAVVPTAAAFGAALAYAITGFFSRFRRTIFLAVGVAVSVASVILDLKLHPQFYTYSHVFGGLLGPVYDADLSLRPGVFTFRIVTLLWIGVLWAVGGVVRGRTTQTARLVGSLSAVALVAAYALRGALGFNTTYGMLRAELSASVLTEHFEIRYDPVAPLRTPVHQLAEEQEYVYHRLEGILGSAPEERTVVYLYGDPNSKARLTGSRSTSVTPVWLGKPQIHILADQHGASFGHELVHVFGREFGAPFLNASYSVGLVEGLAVSLEPPSLWIGADDQVRTAARFFGWSANEIAARVSRAITPTGFWSDRGAVVYAMSGSFTGFLLDRFGVEAFKQLYRSGGFEATYQAGLDSLSASWASWLMSDTTAIDFGKQTRVSEAFSVASLFERPCPHVMPSAMRHVVRGDESWYRGDTSLAEVRWRDAAEDERLAAPMSERLALAALYRGEPERASALLTERDSTWSWLALVVRADARAITGSLEEATAVYDSAFAMVEGGLIEEASVVALHRALAVNGTALRALYRAPSGDLDAQPELAWGAAVAARRKGSFAAAITFLEGARLPGGNTPEPIHEWYRHVAIARSAAAAGLWGRAEEAWRDAAAWASSPGMEAYGYAVEYAAYKRGEAQWIASHRR